MQIGDSPRLKSKWNELAEHTTDGRNAWNSGQIDDWFMEQFKERGPRLTGAELARRYNIKFGQKRTSGAIAAYVQRSSRLGPAWKESGI